MHKKLKLIIIYDSQTFILNFYDAVIKIKVGILVFKFVIRQIVFLKIFVRESRQNLMIWCDPYHY